MPSQEYAPLGYTLVQIHVTTGSRLLGLHPGLPEPLLHLFFSLEPTAFYLLNLVVVHQVHKMHNDFIVIICCQCFSDVQKHDRSCSFVLKN